MTVVGKKTEDKGKKSQEFKTKDKLEALFKGLNELSTEN